MEATIYLKLCRGSCQDSLIHSLQKRGGSRSAQTEFNLDLPPVFNQRLSQEKQCHPSFIRLGVEIALHKTPTYKSLARSKLRSDSVVQAVSRAQGQIPGLLLLKFN